MGVAADALTRTPTPTDDLIAAVAAQPVAAPVSSSHASVGTDVTVLQAIQLLSQIRCTSAVGNLIRQHFSITLYSSY